MTKKVADPVVRQFVHDLNNNLSAAIAYIDFIDMDVPSDSPARKSVDRLMKAVQAALDTTASLRAYNKGEPF